MRSDIIIIKNNIKVIFYKICYGYMVHLIININLPEDTIQVSSISQKDIDHMFIILLSIQLY